MGIYHMKKQTKNIPRSCSYLLLKTLFYFISQCTSVPFLENGLCKLDMSWTTAILYLFSQETYLLIKVIMKCVNIKLGYTGRFSLHIERPSYVIDLSKLTQHNNNINLVCFVYAFFCYSFLSQNFVPPQYLKSRGITLLLFLTI